MNFESETSLPDKFVAHIRELMGEDRFGAFLEGMKQPAPVSIRLNPLKAQGLRPCANMQPQQVEWCKQGWYLNARPQFTFDPLFHAGVYYVQEASSMFLDHVLRTFVHQPVSMLDLCAAPGGKTTCAFSALPEGSRLMSNEPLHARAQILKENVIKFGSPDIIVTNNYVADYARTPLLFDVILTDVPCSGEGMFRRDPSAVKSWERYGPVPCSKLQDSILESAHIMLKPGGEIVYSTCTYGVLEDEDRIVNFMNNHPGYEVVPHPEILGVTHAPEGSKLPGSMRIWPHISEGDGHFCVHLRKLSGEEGEEAHELPSFTVKKRGKNVRETDAVLSFMKDILNDDAYEKIKTRVGDALLIRGEHAMLPACDEKALGSLTVVKNGLYLGEFKAKGRDFVLVPSNSLALTLRREDIKDSAVISYAYDAPELIRYLKGETLTTEPGAKGYVVITVDGHPLGFGKRSADGMIKNLYPKSWRLL